MNNDDIECEVCKLYNKASEDLFEGVNCPYCNSVVLYPDYEYEMIGENNTSNPSQVFKNLPIIQCGECNNKFALNPIKIIYNANHDISYTGAGSYLVNFDRQSKESLRLKIEDKINNYLSRVSSGENLDPSNLSQWIMYTIEGDIAKLIKENS
jgi:predicted nucleic acid-binding Zn ribbon protein